MGLKFSNFEIKGIDVSQWQGSIEWDKTMNMHPDFAAIKVGAGKTTDPRFAVNWSAAKDKVFRIAYFYMDYYSNYFPTSSAYGMTDEAWGKAQADYCWNLMKSDPAYVFLDIENAKSSTALPITNYTSRAQKIAKAFLERMDVLNGKTNGIYCSLGLLTWFGTWFKNRPLWVAWYNETQTIQTVITAVKGKGWTGKILMWQYASDGDVDDNGYGDGVLYGMDSNALDLNIWTESKEEFEALKGGVVIPEPPPPPAVIIPAMDVIAFSQNNTQWSGDKLGTSDRTIGSDGCVISGAAVVANYFGHVTDPGKLNRDLINIGGYASGNLFIWDALHQLYPDITVDWDMFIRDTSLITDALIDAVLLSKRLVMAQVDYNPTTVILEPHWVVILGKDANDYIILDLIDGKIVSLKSRYAKIL